MADLVIVGISPVGKIAYEYFTYDSPYKVAAFAVNESYLKDCSEGLLGLPVIPIEELECRYPSKTTKVFVAFGSGRLNRDRMEMYEYLKERGYSFASYVSTRAFVWKNVTIGDNCFILEDNTLQPFVKIGNNVTLWSGNHIGHESVIKDNCFISSHVVISGLCTVKENSFIGVNSSIADNVIIAKDNFIALGSVINRNTEENKVYKGNPAVAVNVSAKRFCNVKE